MDQEVIVRRCNAMIAKEFELDEAQLVPEANLYDDLELDSLDSVDLIAGLEREFGVKIDRQKEEKELRGLRTLGQVYSFIGARVVAA